MLTIRTYLDQSNIEGVGCFAGEFIKAGSVLWKLEPLFDKIITNEEYDTLPKITQEYLYHFAYYNKIEGGFILCSDNAKYFNHSEFPNCVAKGLETIATKDILAGEEITENYFNFDELANVKLNK